jgi:hypothetical protein
LFEAFVGVPGRDEFLTDVALVAESMKFPHDGWEVDFLLIIQFVSPWATGHMDMSNDIDVFIQSAHDISVHDLNVIDIKEHLYSL